MPRFANYIFSLLLALASIAQDQNGDRKDTQRHGGVVDTQTTWDALRLYQPNQSQGDWTGLTWQQVNPQDPTQSQGYFAFQERGDFGSGLTLVAVDDAVREHLKLPKGQGLIASSVAPQGMAARAGIRENDILLTLGDAPLRKAEDLEERLKAAGDKPLGLVLLHQGAKKTVQVQPQIKVTFGPVQPQPPAFWIGVSVSPVEPALRSHLQLPADQGLVATEVVADGPAAKAGLKVNDILLTLNGKPLKDQATLIDLVQKNGDKLVAVELVREGARQKLELTPQRRGSNSVGMIIDRRHPNNLTYSYVHPGVVVNDGQNWKWTGDLLTNSKSWDVQTFNNLVGKDPKAQSSEPEGGSLSKRLDGMSVEIKELRKAIDELSKVLKDRR